MGDDASPDNKTVIDHAKEVIKEAVDQLTDNGESKRSKISDDLKKATKK